MLLQGKDIAIVLECSFIIYYSIIKMKVFISFSNKDNLILQSFVDHYLKLGLQLKNSEISCTGIEDSKPETGDDFRFWIKKEIEEADLIFLLISRNYKNSEVCLNEMGATWILNKKVIPLLLPPIDYSHVGFLHQYNQILKIESRDDLFKLWDDLKGWFKDRSISHSHLNSQIDKLHKELNSIPNFLIIKENQEYNISPPDFSYFNQFLLKNIDHRSLFLQAQPTLADCKAVFDMTFFKDVYDYYSMEFKSLLHSDNVINDLSVYDTYDMIFASYDDLVNNKHNLPGGMNALTKNFAIKSNTCFFSIRFRRKQQESGTTISVWTFINNRWVLFIRPWIIVEFLIKAKYDKEINQIVKIFKRMGIFRELGTIEIQYLMNRLNE